MLVSGTMWNGFIRAEMQARPEASCLIDVFSRTRLRARVFAWYEILGVAPFREPSANAAHWPLIDPIDVW